MKITLKGLIVAKFGSAQAFGDAVGWSGRKARDIVSGRQKPNNAEMLVISKAIGIDSPEMFCQIFLPDVTTMWANSGRKKDAPEEASSIVRTA